MSAREKTEEEKLRSKRVHALVMMILGAIMAACALAAGLIALAPGAFPSWMSGGFARRERPALRAPAEPRVAFQEWSPQALARARAEGRLVLLHLTAFWSRDGRVMEETTYADEKIAAWIAARAVPVRLDADLHPELAERYGVGAWPTTALLDADGRALASGAFLTPKLFAPWAELIDESLRRRPEQAEALARRELELRGKARASRPALSDAEWAAKAAERQDPVWGGIYGHRGETGSGGKGFEKTLEDQARFVAASADRDAARRALAFVERFMSVPDGYAGSVRGEAEAELGGVMEGFAYFALDDAGRRAVGLPALDRRLLPGPARRMAQAVLGSPVASAAQKAHARRVLGRLGKEKR